MRAVQRSIRPGEWIMFDGGRKIAVLLKITVVVEGQPRTLIRSVTYADRSEDRALIGAFADLATAAHFTWRMWVQATTKGPAQPSGEG